MQWTDAHVQSTPISFFENLLCNVLLSAGTTLGIGILGAVLAAQTIYVSGYLPGVPPNFRDVTRQFGWWSGNIR